MPQSDTSGRAALKSGTAQKLSAGLCLVHCFPKPSRHIGYRHTFKQTTKQEQSFLFISTTPKHDYIPQPTAQSSPWWTIPKYYQLQIVLQEQSGVEDNGRAECIDMHPEITPPALFGAKNVLLSHLLFSNSCCTSCLTRGAQPCQAALTARLACASEMLSQPHLDLTKTCSFVKGLRSWVCWLMKQRMFWIRKKKRGDCWTSFIEALNTGHNLILCKCLTIDFKLLEGRDN